DPHAQQLSKPPPEAVHHQGRTPVVRAPQAATQPSHRPDSGDVGQQAARAGCSADRPRSCRRGPRSREAMDKEEERDTPVLYDTYIRRSAVRTTPQLL